MDINTITLLFRCSSFFYCNRWIIWIGRSIRNGMMTGTIPSFSNRYKLKTLYANLNLNDLNSQIVRIIDHPLGIWTETRSQGRFRHSTNFRPWQICTATLDIISITMLVSDFISLHLDFRALSDNQLTGSIPKTIAFLPSLTQLCDLPLFRSFHI